MLNREEIKKLIDTAGLVKDPVDLDTQLTPNGFDLTVKSIFAFEGAGALDFSNKERELPQARELSPEKRFPQDTFGWWSLKPGAYKIVTNETVTLGKDLIGVAFPRSSLLRMGAFTQTGVWDAGFSGKSEFVLHVANPLGVRIKQNARVVQLMFTHITETKNGYSGIYQNT
jgi:dUTP pyrophosphatase